MSCKQYAEFTKSSESGKELDAMEKCGILRKCPRCGHGVVKLENDPGCNKMVCEFEINGVICGEKWCWLCGEKGISYSHFDSGTCMGKLFQGVNENVVVAGD